MGLKILSKNVESSETTFKKVAVCCLRGNLFFAITEWAYISGNRIELNVKKYYNKDIVQSFLMDILSPDEQIDNDANSLNFICDNVKYYVTAGTDNTPSFLCYYFSLQYLRLHPKQLIFIDDIVFSMEAIEKLNKDIGYTENWLINIETVKASFF